jgi:hypothetical protein
MSHHEPLAWQRIHDGLYYLWVYTGRYDYLQFNLFLREGLWWWEREEYGQWLDPSHSRANRCESRYVGDAQREAAAAILEKHLRTWLKGHEEDLEINRASVVQLEAMSK